MNLRLRSRSVLLSSLLPGFLLLGLAAAPRQARAQVVTEQAPPKFPDPKKFSKGFFATGELGATTYFGKLGRAASPGISFGMRAGYDILRYLAIEIRVSGQSSSATTPPPVTGQTFQLFLYGGDVRVTLPIRQVSLSLEGGAALGQLSSNVLAPIGITRKLGLVALGGVVIDYHTLNRHFSFGLAADYLYLHQFGQAHGLQTVAYLRYTH